jgi:hypothetical protein
VADSKLHCCPLLPRTSLLSRGAVEQAIAARGDQVGLTAGAGHMCRIPRALVLTAPPIDVADHAEIGALAKTGAGDEESHVA